MAHPITKNVTPIEAVTPEKDLPYVARHKPEEIRAGPVKELRAGALCPSCQAGRMDYDGVLNLACNNCGFVLSGGAGCT